jgi:hypothetical protein
MRRNSNHKEETLFQMSEVLSKIKTRGYWEVLIRPAKFVENRIESLGRCKEIIRDLSVRWKGWYYPHYSFKNPPTNGIDYIEQSLDFQQYLEFWRYYQSGQFIHFFGMVEDWQDQVTEWSKTNLKPFEALDVIDALYTFTEIYEFMSRLAAKELLGDSCKISITLHRTKNRQLIMLDRKRHFSGLYKSELEPIPREISISTAELMAKSAELSLDHTIWVFEKFNWDNPPRGVLLEDQKKLIERRL